VFATVKLTKPQGTDADKTELFALPCSVFTGGEGQQSVRPLPTKLWEQGWTEVTAVPIKEAHTIRYFSMTKELDDTHLISEHYADEVGEVVESCKEKMLKDKSFKKWIGGANLNAQRWSFIRTVAEKMATMLSVADWKSKFALCQEAKSADTAIKRHSMVEKDFITPTLNDQTSAMVVEGEKTKFKSEVSPNAPTTAKYLSMMMDIMVSDNGPSPSPHQGEAADVNEVGALTKQVRSLEAVITALTGSVNAIATQLNIRDASKPAHDEKTGGPKDSGEANAASPLAVVVKVDGSAHECAHRVMSMVKAVNDGADTTTPTAVIPDDNDAVDATKLALIMRAHDAYSADPEGQQLNFEADFSTFTAQITEEKPDENTWPSETHFVLFSPEHPDVELKIKTMGMNKKSKRSELMTISTRPEHLPAAKMVMYAHWRPGHFDLLGLMENGRVKIAFTPTESTVA
jgi:hypothetical protein